MDDQKKQTLNFLKQSLSTLQQNPQVNEIGGLTKDRIYDLLEATTGIEFDKNATVLSQADQTNFDSAEVRLAWLEELSTSQPEQIIPEIQNNLDLSTQIFTAPPESKNEIFENNFQNNKKPVSFPKIPTNFINKFAQTKLQKFEGAAQHFSPKTIQTAQKLGSALSKIPGVGAFGRTGAKLLAKLGLEGLASGGALALIEIGYQILKQAKGVLSNIQQKLKLNGVRYANRFALSGIIVLIFSPFIPAAIPIGAGLIGVSYAMGGTSAVSAGIGTVFGGIMSIFGATISVAVTPIIVSLVVGPLLLAFIIFIITAGGYMVPPSSGIYLGDGVGGAYPMCWPMYGRITQGPNGTFSHIGYQAIDIAAGENTPVYATHDGTARAGYDPDGYGHYVIITSPEGFQTIYGHLLGTGFSPLFSGSIEVSAGQQIGTSNGAKERSNSGNSSGAHLHYELRPNTLSINSIVPPYIIGGYTEGCFASESGGGSEPIGTSGGSSPSTPETPELPGANACTSAGGACSSSAICPIECQINTFNSACTDSTVCCNLECALRATEPEGYNCTEYGGYCATADTVCDEIALPGEGGWNCPGDNAKCCGGEVPLF